MRPWRPLCNGLKLHYRQFSFTRSSLSEAKPSVDNKAFSKTLLLPKTSFPLRNHPSKDEALQARTCDDLYKWQVGTILISVSMYSMMSTS